MLMRRALLIALFPISVFAADLPVEVNTNIWKLEAFDPIETISFVLAEDITVLGRTLDDSFWLAQNRMQLDGDFGNDVWAIGMSVRLGGTFRDHARIAAQNIVVEGTISNGFWALGSSISAATNSSLMGEHFLYGDQISLLGNIEGNVYAKGRSITVGGTVIGNMKLMGDDIVIRPGTTIIGDLHYVTTNQSIVLDANSHISGNLTHLPAPVTSGGDPTTHVYLQLYFFAAALMVGIPFMMAFPNLTGMAVRGLRINLWKCGLIGIALLFGAPFLLLAIAFTIIGLPLAAVLGALYGLATYLGKIMVALAIGSALLQKRGEISLAGAMLSLVTGLFLYYSLAFVPVIGSSLQATATAFGAGSLILAVLAGRGRVGPNPASVKKEQQA